MRKLKINKSHDFCDMADGDEMQEDSGTPARADTESGDDHDSESENTFEEMTPNSITLPEDYVEEYTDLNNTIDQLDLYLNSLEQRNDNLYAKLQELLESSREARQEGIEQQESEERECS